MTRYLPIWRRLRAYWLGVRDGFDQVQLSSGLTWDEDGDSNESYDRGANAGEALARLTFWRKA